MYIFLTYNVKKTLFSPATSGSTMHGYSEPNFNANLNFIVTFNVMHLNYLNNESLEVHVTIN